MTMVKALLRWGRCVTFAEIYRRCREVGEPWSPTQIRIVLALLEQSGELVEVAPNQFQLTVHGHEQTRN
jgi:Fe2+ or Zn2+ uptake regulation protein